MVDPLWDVIVTTKLNSRMEFKEGVENVVYETVRSRPDGEDLIEALVRAFESMRISLNPNWDGSIA